MQQQETAGSGGPYLQVACLCENVVQRADGVLTLVNIIDRVNLTVAGSDAPLAMPESQWGTYLVIVLKAGRARARMDLEIRLERPDGSSANQIVVSVNFEGEDDRGVQIVASVRINLRHEGLHWFDVRLDGRPLTRLPLRVVYARLIGPASSGAGPTL